MKARSSFAAVLILLAMCSSLLAQNLTDSQKTTLKNSILANTDPVVVQALADGATNVIVAWYNKDASPAFYVWKTNLTVDEVREAVDWEEVVSNLTTNELLAFQILTAMDINPSNDSIRGAFSSIFSGPGGVNSRTALSAAAKRLATEAEKLFADTAGGDGSEATPAKLTFEGDLTASDVVQALAS